VLTTTWPIVLGLHVHRKQHRTVVRQEAEKGGTRYQQATAC
jgi:hypothetical protein